MANNFDSPRLWVLDTVGELMAVGNKVFVRGIHYEPVAAANIVQIGEYDRDGTTVRPVFRLKANAAIDPIDAQFDPPVELNGAYLSTLTAGVIYMMIDKVDTKFVS